MSVSLAEHRLGGLRWIVLNGPDREAFGALGEHVRGELAALAEAWPALPRLRHHVSGSPGRELLAAVRRATAESFPAEWAELAAFAAGARVQFDDLVLLNLRAASRRPIPARPGSWTSSPARRRAASAPTPGREIGRASCRERVSTIV